MIEGVVAFGLDRFASRMDLNAVRQVFGVKQSISCKGINSECTFMVTPIERINQNK